MAGSKNSYIATLVERHTRYVMLAKVANKDTQAVISALIKQAKKLPDELYKSLTWDRGKELTDHRRFTLATNIDVYFCDPQSPWQRGSNENTNGLLRQYFPKSVAEEAKTFAGEVADAAGAATATAKAASTAAAGAVLHKVSTTIEASKPTITNMQETVAAAGKSVAKKPKRLLVKLPMLRLQLEPPRRLRPARSWTRLRGR